MLNILVFTGLKKKNNNFIHFLYRDGSLNAPTVDAGAVQAEFSFGHLSILCSTSGLILPLVSLELHFYFAHIKIITHILRTIISFTVYGLEFSACLLLLWSTVE